MSLAKLPASGNLGSNRCHLQTVWRRSLQGIGRTPLDRFSDLGTRIRSFAQFLGGQAAPPTLLPVRIAGRNRP